MIWQNLKDGKCPKCSNPLDVKSFVDMIICTNELCDFKVTPEKKNEITAKLV